MERLSARQIRDALDRHDRALKAAFDYHVTEGCSVRELVCKNLMVHRLAQGQCQLKVP